MLKLIRISQTETETLGVFVINNKMVALSLELPDKNNENFVSCIPEGKYKMTKEVHPKHKQCFRVHSVPNRVGILLHVANKVSQLEGCISCGLTLINSEIYQSRDAMDIFWELLPDETGIEITKEV
jgi:hypothetical protein